LGGGVLVAGLCAWIFLPFLEAIVWASVLAVMLHPLYEPLRRLVRNASLAAFLLCVLGSLLLALPFYWVASLLPEQVKDLYDRVQTLVQPASNGQPRDERMMRVWSWLAATGQEYGYDLSAELGRSLKVIGAWLVSVTPRLLGGAVQGIFNFVVTFLTLFFFVRDADALMRWLRDLIPLRRGQTEELIAKIRDVVRATVVGGLAVAGAQGLLGGVLFWVLGLPTPVLWGVVMGLFSIVPLLGAWPVWAPAGLILLWQGHIAKGVVLLVGGFFGVSMVDNILRPLIIGQSTRMPTLLIFFSILGGVQAFGGVGLIVGPVLVSLLVGILEYARAKMQREQAAPPAGQAGAAA
jgi:predicted PurR-regulated permease PerM